MQIIQDLCDMIEEEINDAEKYATKAMKCKDKRPGLADTFYKLANEELNHMTALHTQVVNIIVEYRKEHGEPPKPMQAIYDSIHTKHIQHAAMVKSLLSMYKE